ncbi:MAG TPA: SHOCT domain-containing protein [Sulfuricurvum sp.]|nr:MAG: hypothetical protein B7Y30_10695 [Campylobacterales bacterium 16-40-21]OZA02147.1 MAG: hypothetical protein B7X89_10650 [Sulfuricurvum sp. 17-40-25]HQS67688.1 SHOCT domain-containing protein [Sulfuricurvum sp.]HQT36932.1 SHOCT domain-containing protein [Sulfuricurvum sp.]
MNEYGLHGMGFGWLILLLFIILIVYFINNNKREDLSAKDILDKRYANGEIDETEYKIKKAALEK